jgi:hypothetical protein
MHYQTALQQYFDGEIDEVGEDLLFGELAHNHDARREFNEHAKLRAAMQQERSVITPPAHAAGAIFGALGYDTPRPLPVAKTPAVGATTAKSGMFLKLLPYALTSLFSALVAVVIYAGLTENSYKNSAGITAENQKNSIVENEKLPQNLLKDDNFTTGNLHENYTENSLAVSHVQNPGRKFAEEYFKNKIENSSTESVATNVDLSENPFKKQIAVIAIRDFKTDQFLKEDLQKDGIVNDFARKIAFENQDLFNESEQVLPKRFSVEVRSIAARSFPENAVSAQTDILKNMAVSIFYNQNENHAVGLEIGHEQFAQEFKKDVNGQNWNVKQNPMFIYSALGYRYSLSKNEIMGAKITPFGQILFGGTYIGPLAKSSVGFTLTPEERISFLFALEGSVLAYQAGENWNLFGNWNNSRKLGVTYGVNVNF